MEYFVKLFTESGTQTLAALVHNWPYLLASVLIAAALKVYLDSDRVSAFLSRYRGASVLAATGAAVATPFCSCGTTAVVLGMMASTMPLAPIMAFMIASPLSSPEELIYSAGLFGWPFAISYFVASILLGLGGGSIATILEKRGYLRGQIRFVPSAAGKAEVAGSCVCQAKPGAETLRGAGLPAKPAEAAPGAGSRALELIGAAADVSKKLLPMFIGFAFIGYLLNALIPSTWMSALFGKGHGYSVPLAATIGLPLYLSSEASLPLVRALLDSGMSQGAIMAFLIAGSGTSIGAITGALTIARWKVVGIVVGVLWIGAILAGYGFDTLVAAGLA